MSAPGWLQREILAALEEAGGTLTMDDLVEHLGHWTGWKGTRDDRLRVHQMVDGLEERWGLVWQEMPPPGHSTPVHLGQPPAGARRRPRLEPGSWRPRSRLGGPDTPWDD